MGDAVWGRHKNGRYYKSKIVEIKYEQQLCVFFPEDRSFSKDIILTDIIGWEKIGTPIIGQRLQVRWTDGKTYDADYVGPVDNHIYTVSIVFLQGLFFSSETTVLFYSFTSFTIVFHSV